jgi:hypothetical protein
MAWILIMACLELLGRTLLLIAVVTVGFGTSVLPALAQGQPVRECTTLTCVKCEKICTDTCAADFKVCSDKGAKNCPRASRSCERSCKSQLCAQCMPVQYGSNNKKFLPGKTEICRTPGRSE